MPTELQEDDAGEDLIVPEVPNECGQGEATSCEDHDSRGEWFREAFDGDPATPESRMNALEGWFAQPTMQGPSGWATAPEPMMAQHSQNCGPPPAAHRITSFEDSVYSCKNHLMTAINPPSTGTASGVVSLKPDHMVDLSRGEAVVRIDVSTLSASMGDWWEIWITPPSEHLVAPADHWFHQAGRPERALFFQVVDSSDGKKFWVGKGFRDYEFVAGTENWWETTNIRPIVSFSDKRRDTYEVRITDDWVKMLVENSETGQMELVDEFPIPSDLLGEEAVVQFLQSNYEPEKNGKVGCSDPCPDTKSPTTWHWDNAEIFPAKPYELIGTEEYMVHGDMDSDAIHFDEPAPAGADLMFVAQSRGNAPELSFDDGETWTSAVAVRPPNDPPEAGFGGDPDLLTYRIAVPEGSESARIRGREATSDLTWVGMNFHLLAGA